MLLDTISLSGLQLRLLLALNNAGANEAISAARNFSQRWNPGVACSRLPDAWGEYFTLHSSSIAAFQEGRKVDAYEKYVAALPSFIKAFREDTDAWVVLPMHSVVHNLRAIAESADAELVAINKRAEKLADAGDQLRKCFSVSLQAPGNKEKKLAALDVVNVSIKIYFRLNTLRLCKNLTRTVESRQFADFDMFPASQKVTYKFYKGRLAVFDEDYQEAEESLSYALRHCHRGAINNKARILKYLLPVQLVLGRLPCQRLMVEYSSALGQYAPLVTALRDGNVAEFNSAMNTNQFKFIAEGTYLVLEKLRQTVYRGLFKKVAAVHGEVEPSKATQIPLLSFAKALELQGLQLSMDELECVVANLIHRKYIKGYISHQHKVVVVAKSMPFPSLNSVSFAE